MTITGAENNELIQIGTTELIITINTRQYQIKVYVVEGLNCKLLLGNDFNIRYNLIVDFKNKNIQIIDNNSIKMNVIWYEHNVKHNLNVFGTGSIKCKTQNNETMTNENEIRDDEGTIINISKELNDDQRIKASKLIKRFKHLFTSDPLDIGCANVEPCEIKLKSDKPIFKPLYRAPPNQREKLKTLINKMIKADIIEPSRSNYAAPVFLIPKKEKCEYRSLVDYRKLNNETISDKHPIPRSQDLFRSLEGVKYYSSIDLC